MLSRSRISGSPAAPPGQRLEGVPALAHQRRALPEMQRLAVHRGHQAPRRGNFPCRERPSQIVGDQGERALVRQPVQLTGTATAAQNRLGRADHQAAAGQYLKQITDLVRAGAQIVDSDNGADLAEQPGALLGGQLDRLIADIQLGHQVLQQIPDTIPARAQVDATGGKTALGRGSCDVPQQRRLTEPAGGIESGRGAGPHGSERVSRLPVPAHHQGFPQRLGPARGEQITRGCRSPTRWMRAPALLTISARRLP
jgi:hypothetical protein